MKTKNLKIRVDHITHESGNSVIRETESISNEVRQHFRNFQTVKNSQRIHIEQTNLFAEVENFQDFSVFKLFSKNNELLATNVCSFGDESEASAQKFIIEYSKDRRKNWMTVAKSSYFLYTFQDLNISFKNLMLLGDLLEAGEIELYIYDALFFAYEKRKMTGGFQQEETNHEKAEKNNSSTDSNNEEAWENIFFRMYEVGKPYEENVSHYMHEGPKFDFQNAGGILEIYYNNPTPKEIKDIKEGDIKFGLLYKQDIIFFFIKFGEGNWMDMPYNVNLSKFDSIHEITDLTSGYGITIMLIDSADGILKVIRHVAMTNRMSKDFRKMIEKQRNTAYNRNEEYSKISTIYNKYRTTDLLKEGFVYKQQK